MTVLTFSIACILSLPKQLITVYIGVIIEESGTGKETAKDKLISDAVLALTVAITCAAMWYILRKMRLVKPDVIYARRKARQAKLERADFTPYGISNDSSNSVIFNPQGSETNIPLNTGLGATGQHQRWDKEGRAVGYAGDPRLYAPEPQRPQGRMQTSQTGLDAGGSGPSRQESGDLVELTAQGRRDTFDIPRIESPVHEPFNNPFERTPTGARQASYPPTLAPPLSASSPYVTQTPTQSQYANFNQQPTATTDITSPPLANPFTGVTPTQFNHPQVPYQGQAVEATAAGFYDADGRSRGGAEGTSQGAAGRAFSPPPPSYLTNGPGQ